MGCLFALLAVFAPRIALLVLWLFTPYVNAAFNTWIWPLLGFIFLPFTTVIYVFVVIPLGSTNFWGWLCLILALFVDIRNFHDTYANQTGIRRFISTSGNAPRA
jgi:hypothetical protein